MTKSKPHFRAVVANGVRRGLSLEPIFWQALEDIATRENISNGALVAKIADQSAEENKNLSSSVRAYITGRLRDERASFEKMLSLPKIGQMVNACPAPSFVLSIDKRILSYNQAFIAFLQLRFASVGSDNILKSIVLSLETSIEKVIAELDTDAISNYSCGFAIGMADKSVRGKLSIVRISVSGLPSIIAFIVE